MPGTGTQWVRDRADFERFFAVLTHTSRKPVVVVTIAEGDEAPRIDVDELLNELGDSVHLFVLPATATFWLTDELGGKALSVHSGWARVYPSSPAWRTDRDLAPSFRPGMAGRRKETGRIVEAALAAAFRGGMALFEEPPATGSVASAVVAGVMSATQVLVEIDGRSQAIMRTHSFAAGLPADRLVSVGQRFTGLLVPMGMMGEFTPTTHSVDQVRRAIDFVGDGVVTSVAVAGVTRDRVRLLLHPEVEIDVMAGVDEDPTTLAREGDVVTVEIIRLEGQFLATYSAEEPAPAMSFLPGGPPWIVARQEPVDQPDPVDQQEPVDLREPRPLQPAATPVTAELAQIAALEDELERLEQRHRRDQETIRQMQQANRLNRRLSVPVVHSDPEAQFRLEVELDYLSRVEEPDRAKFSWPTRYHVGGDFLPSLAQLVRDGGIAREKIVSVCADILSGRAREMPNRAVKEWRTSARGPQRKREADGAVAMRARLQTGASAARRLRYWVLRNGEIELDWVGVHDEGLAS